MIDFLKYRYVCYAASVVFLIAGGIAFATKGFKYAVDFSGGSELRISFEKPISTSLLRESISALGYKDAVIQNIGANETSFIIQVKESGGNVGEKLFQDLKTKFPTNIPVKEKIDWVGPEVGNEIKFNAIISILLGLLIILLYITVRARYRFAVGAVVSIAHDALFVLSAFLLLGEQISIHVIAAVLTIVGYSLNDTIVVFYRTIENMGRIKDKTEEEIVNLSINQTLRRTLLTSSATLLSVVSIFFLGGEALRSFSLAMIIGIIVGTYSSIYIASPIMLAIKPTVTK